METTLDPRFSTAAPPAQSRWGLPPPNPRRPVTPREELEKVVEALLLFGVYALIARGDMVFHVDGHRLDVALDRVLPFSAPWVYAYVTFYVFAFAPLLYMRRASWFRRVFAGMAAVMAVSYAVYLLFPTRMVLRPTLAGVPGVTAWLLRLVYGADGGYSCFPSMHVGLSHLAAWSLGAVDRRVIRWAWACAALITVSTVLLKQHYLADVVAGALLAGAAHWLTLGRFARRHPAEADDRRARWVLTALVVLQALGMLAVLVAYRVR